MPVGEPDYLDDDLITMTDSDGMNVFTIHDSSKEYSCVDNFKLYGGPTQPFEYLVLAVSKKRMSVLAPMLVDDIFAGANIVTIYGFGKNGAQFIVTNCKLSGSTWKITAYSFPESFKACTLTDNAYIKGNAPDEPDKYSLLGTSPSTTIRNIIQNPDSSLLTRDGGQFSKRTIFHTFIAYRTGTSSSVDQFRENVLFSSGTSAWRVIVLCALKLGCNVWVDGDTLYAVDLSLTSSDQFIVWADEVSTTQYPINVLGTVYLNTEGQFPYSPTLPQLAIMNNVLGTPSPEQEGRNFIRNRVQINIDTDSDSLGEGGVVDPSTFKQVLKKGQVVSGIRAGESWTYIDDRGRQHNYSKPIYDDSLEVSNSKNTYGVIAYEMDAPELSRADAQAIADAMALKYCDSEQPITFSMREVKEVMNGGKKRMVWNPAFPVLTRADRIFDYSNDLLLSTTSNTTPSAVRPEKCALTGWVRNFPEHTTTYTFGEIAPTDMTQNDSIIKSALASKSM